MDKDLIGRPLEPAEKDVLEVYARLKELCAMPGQAPCVQSNLRFATAAIAQVVTDLGLDYEHLYDLGV
ncbi:MAG: hypothetical protein H6807_17940 [Planctomycetes bacterium]|nr:hypothetical protein [Planctomycetota bacterium]